MSFSSSSPIIITTTTTTAAAAATSVTTTKITPKKASKFKALTRKQVNVLVIDSDIAIRDALEEIRKARALAAKAGLSIECNTLPKTVYTPVEPVDAFGIPVEAQIPLTSTTGGHSNTDHTVLRTGDDKADRIAELRRNCWRRHRRMEPETRQEGRWDRPRQPGERRRRILREVDRPDAPPEPPFTGFTAFLCQMTVKLRHDRPETPHDQSRVMQEVSKLWKIGLTDEDRQYYNKFANDARDEYNRQMIEYRATGTFTPNAEFVKLSNANVWVRKEANRNDLEKELCSYETVVFPKRPPSMDEAYALREQRGIFRRRLRLKGLENSDGTLKNGLDFEVLFKEYQEKATLKEHDDRTSGDSSNSHIDDGEDSEEDMDGVTGVQV